VRKSYEIFRLVCRYYHPNGTPEQWARTWNGGADGAREACTVEYWMTAKPFVDCQST